ncbi:MAG: pitrilysin family protein [Planctomycetota bacterium]|nr:pitrilysin family protein [Planctomycetota bacterium]
MSVEFKHATLGNGMEIAAEIMPKAHTAAIGFFVKTGARDEVSPLMGVSHFLEHMMFQGTETRSAEDVDRDFDALGAVHNAFTSSEMTAFYAHCLPEHLMKAEAILADILRPSLRVEDFDSEKKVILEEIAMYADQPFWQLYEKALEEYYGAHPLSHRVLGTNETIHAMQRDQMREYFTERYSADNIVVSLAGNLDFDAMVQCIDATCGEWNVSGTQRKYPEATREPKDFSITSDKVHRNYSIMISPAPSADDDRRFAASVLAHVLGDSDGSRFYWSLVDPGLAEEAEASYDSRDGLGEYFMYCVCDPDRREEVEAKMLEQTNSLIDSLTEDDLQRVRSRLATNATLGGELPAGRMKRLGRIWTYQGEYRSLEEDLECINKVSIDDLRALWEEFPMQPVVTGRMRPE